MSDREPYSTPARAAAVIMALQQRAEGIREQRDTLIHERNELLRERDAWKARLQADHTLIQDLYRERNALGKRLQALTEAIHAAADEHGLRDDAGDA